MMRKTIKAGATVPKGYRVSWIKAETDDYVCYPLGVHWFMTKFYRWWVRSLRYGPIDFEIREMRSYRQGYEDGSAGRDEKFKQFQASCEKEMANDKDQNPQDR